MSLPEVMRAAVFYGGPDVRIERIPRPAPGPGQVLVRVRAAGICGSDLHRYRGLDPWSDDRSGAVRAYRAGHELAGTVNALGAGVEESHRNIEPGMAVAVEPMQLAGCGNCKACRLGANALCSERPPQRLLSAGFSEWDLAIPEHLHPVVAGTDFALAALADVYACALHAVHRCAPSQGESALVIGSGSVALALGQILREQQVVVCLLARSQLGAQTALDVGAADEVTALEALDLGNQSGSPVADRFDIAFEVVGGRQSDTARLAVAGLVPRGRLVILGAFDGDVRIPYRLANRKEATVLWSNGYGRWHGRSEFGEALAGLIDERWRAARLISHRFPLSQIDRAFATAARGSRIGAIKVMVEP